MSKITHTLLSQLLIILLLSSCYTSTGFQSKSQEKVIDEEIEVSNHQHSKTNKNYKVELKNGTRYKYCCVVSRNKDVVFFNKIIKKDGQEVYEPHGHFISSIKDIKFKDETANSDNDGAFGGFLFELFMISVDLAIESAWSDNSVYTSDSSSSRNSKNGRSSTSSSSGSKSVKGKRSRR